MGNLNNFFNLCQQMQNSGNPAQFISQMSGIDIQKYQNPNDAIQYLLNTGKVTQAQVNNAMQMRNNPMFKQLFKI